MSTTTLEEIKEEKYSEEIELCAMSTSTNDHLFPDHRKRDTDNDTDSPYEQQEAKHDIYPHQISLKIDEVAMVLSDSDESIILSDKQQTEVPEAKYVHYTLSLYPLNQIKVEMFDESATGTDSSTNRICLYCKYRNKYMTDHRQLIYNIILCPYAVILIIFCIFISLSINERINTSTISYINSNTFNNRSRTS